MIKIQNGLTALLLGVVLGGCQSLQDFVDTNDNTNITSTSIYETAPLVNYPNTSGHVNKPKAHNYNFYKDSTSVSTKETGDGARQSSETVKPASLNTPAAPIMAPTVGQ